MVVNIIVIIIIIIIIPLHFELSIHSITSSPSLKNPHILSTYMAMFCTQDILFPYTNES